MYADYTGNITVDTFVGTTVCLNVTAITWNFTEHFSW